MEATNDWEFHEAGEIQAYVETNGVAGIDKLFKKKLEGWKDVEINMAITGDSGTGKSSFINAIRGVGDDDINAAEVGLTGSATEPKCFPHPSNNKIKFWDLPGTGSPDYPTLEIYCSKLDLESYDTFLIFTANRFTKHVFELAKKVRSLKKNFFLIRTKIDENVLSGKRKKSFNEEAMLNEIKGGCSKNLGDLVQNSRDIFLISNHDPEKWEFARLTQAILDVLPVRQREALKLRTLDTLSSDALPKKIQILRSRIWKFALISAAVALVPFPGLCTAVNLILVVNGIRSFRSQLGLPDESSTEFLKLTVDNQEKIRRFIFSTAAPVSRFFAAYSAISVAAELIRYIPFVGLAIPSSVSFGATYHFLQRCLTEMEKTVFSVLDNIATQSIRNI